MGLFSKKKKEVTAQSNAVVGNFQNSQTSASLEGNDQGAVQQAQQTQQPQPNAADIYNAGSGYHSITSIFSPCNSFIMF